MVGGIYNILRVMAKRQKRVSALEKKYIQQARWWSMIAVGLSVMVGFVLVNQPGWREDRLMPQIARIQPTESRLAAGMYVGYDQEGLIGNGLDFANGSQMVFSWRQLEPAENNYAWDRIDRALAKLSSGKRAIIRLVVRHENAGVEEFTPAWLLADKYQPIKLGSKRVLNYIDPRVKKERKELIRLMAERYKNDARVAAVEIGVGYSGESNPEPGSYYVADREAQRVAYVEAGYTDKVWSAYHKEIVAAYVEAWQGSDKELLTLIGGAFSDKLRGNLVNYAISRGVGLVATDLRADMYSNRGSGGGMCYWGAITRPGYGPTDRSAFETTWAALAASAGRVPIGWEFNNRYDSTGYITNNEHFTWWAELNALDKKADYIVPLNDGNGKAGNVNWPAPNEFFQRYAGKSAKTTPAAWIVFRSSKPDLTGSWCPDIFDYSFYIQSSLEKIGYYTKDRQVQTNIQDVATRAFRQGPSSDWRYWYARKTSDQYPQIKLDVNDVFADRTDGFRVKVNYLAQSGGVWELFYDSRTGRKSAGKVKTDDETGWQEKVFELPDAKLNNGMDGYDLVLDRTDSQDEVFSMVEVEPLIDLIPTATLPPASTNKREVKVMWRQTINLPSGVKAARTSLGSAGVNEVVVVWGDSRNDPQHNGTDSYGPQNNQDIFGRYVNKKDGKLEEELVISQRGEYHNLGRYDNESWPRVSYDGATGNNYYTWMTIPDTTLAKAVTSGEEGWRQSSCYDVAFGKLTAGETGRMKINRDLARYTKPADLNYDWSCQQEPVMVTIGKGRSLVVWYDTRERFELVDGLVKGKDIYGRVMNKNAGFESGELLLSTVAGRRAPYYQEAPSLAWGDKGGLVVWEDERKVGRLRERADYNTSMGYREIYGTYLGSDGRPRGENFGVMMGRPQVETGYGYYDPDIAWSPQGYYVVAAVKSTNVLRGNLQGETQIWVTRLDDGETEADRPRAVVSSWGVYSLPQVACETTSCLIGYRKGLEMYVREYNKKGEIGPEVKVENDGAGRRQGYAELLADGGDYYLSYVMGNEVRVVKLQITGETVMLPTAMPTNRPTATPTARPTVTSTLRPTTMPISGPTATPTVMLPTVTPVRIQPTVTPMIRSTAISMGVTPTNRPMATPIVMLTTATPISVRPTVPPTPTVAERGAETPLQAATVRISALTRLTDLLERLTELLTQLGLEF